MTNINKPTLIGIAFFSVMLIAFMGIADASTVALLAGAMVGMAIAGVTTAIVLSMMRKSDATTVEQPPPAQLTHIHMHHHHAPQIVVVVNVPANADAVTQRWAVARELHVAPAEAQRMIDAGEVKCLPAKQD